MMYLPQYLSEPILLSYGNWTSENGLKVNPDDKYRRRQDLRGVHLRSTTDTWAPYTISGVLSDGTVTYSGFFAEIYSGLQELMNFTYSMSMYTQQYNALYYLL